MNGAIFVCLFALLMQNAALDTGETSKSMSLKVSSDSETPDDGLQVW